MADEAELGLLARPLAVEPCIGIRRRDMRSDKHQPEGHGGSPSSVWDHSVFSKNRDRLLEGNIAARFLAAVLDQPRVKKLLSTDHFTVDGTLIEAWASLKSFKPRDGSDEPPASGGRNTEADFHGKKRSNGFSASQ